MATSRSWGRSSRRQPACWAPGARSWRLSRSSGIPWAGGSRRRTAWASARSPTARLTTSCSHRARDPRGACRRARAGARCGHPRLAVPSRAGAARAPRARLRGLAPASRAARRHADDDRPLLAATTTRSWTSPRRTRVGRPRLLRAFVRGLGHVGSALDLGCGDGRLTAELDAAELIAADVSPGARGARAGGSPALASWSCRPMPRCRSTTAPSTSSSAPRPSNTCATSSYSCRRSAGASPRRDARVHDAGEPAGRPAPHPLFPHLRFFTRRFSSRGRSASRLRRRVARPSRPDAARPRYSLIPGSGAGRSFSRSRARAFKEQLARRTRVRVEVERATGSFRAPARAHPACRARRLRGDTRSRVAGEPDHRSLEVLPRILPVVRRGCRSPRARAADRASGLRSSASFVLASASLALALVGQRERFVRGLVRGLGLPDRPGQEHRGRDRASPPPARPRAAAPAERRRAAPAGSLPSGPRPATKPAATSAITAGPGTNQVQSIAEWMPNASAQSSDG